MSIRAQIDSCIQQVTARNGEITATLCFGKDFIGFQGHFPRNPILPGMCLLETVLVLIERFKGKSVHMTELMVSKFFAVVHPDQRVTVDCKLNGDTVIANVTIDTQRIAQIKMKAAYAQETDLF
jgi:3-hydroxyacyl-[acyl-carrier-protein] dehydratase